jgi:hypothetical protein
VDEACVVASYILAEEIHAEWNRILGKKMFGEVARVDKRTEMFGCLHQRRLPTYETDTWVHHPHLVSTQPDPPVKLHLDVSRQPISCNCIRSYRHAVIGV